MRTNYWCSFKIAPSIFCHRRDQQCSDWRKQVICSFSVTMRTCSTGAISFYTNLRWTHERLEWITQIIADIPHTCSHPIGNLQIGYFRLIAAIKVLEHSIIEQSIVLIMGIRIITALDMVSELIKFWIVHSLEGAECESDLNGRGGNRTISIGYFFMGVHWVLDGFAQKRGVWPLFEVLSSGIKRTFWSSAFYTKVPSAVVFCRAHGCIEWFRI